MLIDFFNELYSLVRVENEYLLDSDEVDSEYIQNLTMKKKMLRDKIEKKQKYMTENGETLSEESKEIVKNIIDDILLTEKANKELYHKKMEFIKKSLGSLHKERQVKTTYIKSGMKMSTFDTKK